MSADTGKLQAAAIRELCKPLRLPTIAAQVLSTLIACATGHSDDRACAITINTIHSNNRVILCVPCSCAIALSKNRVVGPCCR